MPEIDAHRSNTRNAAARRKYYHLHLDEVKDAQRRYYLEHQDERKEYATNRNRQLRYEALLHYSCGTPRCECCESELSNFWH
jgi:hypothetical protein